MCGMCGCRGVFKANIIRFSMFVVYRDRSMFESEVYNYGAQNVFLFVSDAIARAIVRSRVNGFINRCGCFMAASVEAPVPLTKAINKIQVEVYLQSVRLRLARHSAHIGAQQRTLIYRHPKVPRVAHRATAIEIVRNH